MSRFVRNYFEKAEALANEGRDFIVFTWTKSLGHAPQELGAKAIVTREGLHWGTIGGGKVEAKAIHLAMSTLAEGKLSKAPVLLEWDLQRDVGMSCGGSVEMLMETFPADSFRVYVFGAGHVSQALVRALALLDCHVSCVDTRPEWLERLPPANSHFDPILVDSMESFAEEIPKEAYCVLVTKGHATDFPILQRLVRRTDLNYLGVIGSTVKARKIKAELKAEGFDDDQCQNFRCPMGIGFKSHEPAEIAFSIVAELLMVKNGKHRTMLAKEDR